MNFGGSSHYLGLTALLFICGSRCNKQSKFTAHGVAQHSAETPVKILANLLLSIPPKVTDMFRFVCEL